METPIIQIQHLKYHYPNTKSWAINNVNLSVYKGQWVSLIGLNGSGKSTLVKLIDGLLTNFKGRIKVDHLLLTSKNLLSIRSKIGIIFQNPQDQFVGTTVKEEIAFGLENKRISPKRIKQLIRWALKAVGMTGYQDTLINELSGGQQQRIAIADIIVMKPKIMIMDEATSMLNPQGRIAIFKLIHKLKKTLHLTVIDITHDVEETRYAQVIAVISHGRIVMSGSPKQIFNHEQRLKSLHIGIPAVDRLRDLLRDRGLSVPNHHLTSMEMISWLQKLFLKK